MKQLAKKRKSKKKTYLRKIKPEKWNRSSMDWLMEMLERLTGWPNGSEIMDVVMGPRWHETEVECLTGRIIPHKWSLTEGPDGKKVQTEYVLKRVTQLIEEWDEDPRAEYGPFNAAKKIANIFLEKHRGLVVGTEMGILA